MLGSSIDWEKPSNIPIIRIPTKLKNHVSAEVLLYICIDPEDMVLNLFGFGATGHPKSMIKGWVVLLSKPTLLPTARISFSNIELSLSFNELLMEISE